MTIAVVSPYADRLAEEIAPCLPGGVLLFSATSASELPHAALAANVAFGAPDELALLLERLPDLRWVQSTWAGITPLLEQPRRDFVLTGVKEIFGAAMSEYMLGWVLALKRSILTYAAAESWEFRRDEGLAGLRLGVAGTGSIGREVARRCSPFFAETVGLNSDGRPLPEFARCFATADRIAFARDLDVLAMVLPDTPATDGLISEAELDVMRQGAVLLNGGRANSLDLGSALTALEGGRLSGLVLDVFEKEPLRDDDPLWRTPGVYITSHSAAPTDVTAVVQIFMDNLQRYASGSPLAGVIDFDKGY